MFKVIILIIVVLALWYWAYNSPQGPIGNGRY